jgi:hypothetical protein
VGKGDIVLMFFFHSGCLDRRTGKIEHEHDNEHEWRIEEGMLRSSDAQYPSLPSSLPQIVLVVDW